MGTRIVQSGTLYRPGSNLPWAGASVRVKLLDVFATGSITYPTEERTISADDNGLLPSFTLGTPDSGAVRYAFVLPDDTALIAPISAGAATTLEAIINSVGSATVPASAVQALIEAYAEPRLGNPAANGYALTSTTAGLRSWAAQSAGVTDHGALTGLADDDHAQYLNQARGDARYYTETEADALIAAEAITRANADAVLTASLTTHTGNTSNPHSTTASQVGAYTTAQTDTALAAKVDSASLTELVQDVVGAFVAGAGSVTISYNDAGNTLTITGTGVTQSDGDVRYARLAAANTFTAGQKAPSWGDGSNFLMRYDAPFVGVMLRNAADTAREGLWGGFFRTSGVQINSDTITVTDAEVNTVAWRGAMRIINLVNSAGISWSSTAAIGGAADIALTRNAAGVLEIDNGTAGQWGGLKAGVRDAGTTTIVNGLTLGHQSTGTPAAGLGIGVQLNLNSSTTADQDAARLTARWGVATHATRTSVASLETVSSGGALTSRLEADAGSGANTTGLLLWDVNAGTLKRVEVGAADSGGAGYRQLRILN